MNDAHEFRESAPANGFHYRERRTREERDNPAPSENGRMSPSMKNGSRTRREREPAAKPIDAWFIAEILLPRWRWVVLAGLVLAAMGWSVGMFAWKKTFTATAQLLRYEPMATGDFFKPQPLSQDTFANILKSPELLQMVASKLQPALSSEVLSKCVLIKNDSESDIVKVMVKGYNPQFAVNVANLYADTAVEYTRDLQKRDAENINRAYIHDRVAQMDKDIAELEKEFRALPQSAFLMAKLNQFGGTVTNLNTQLRTSPASYLGTARMAEKLQTALDELATLTQKYTDAHPAVKQARDKVAAIENQLAHTTNSAGGVAPLASAGTSSATPQLFNPDYEIIHGKLAALATSRQQLADRQQEARAFIEDPPGNVRFFAPATTKSITPDHRWLKVGLLTIFCGITGIAFALAGIFFVEFMDGRLKTASDVQRVTNLPVIATLDNLDGQTATAREQWAFRTWTMLQGRLSPSPNHGLVCGITSSKAGEGRSTWINLLADAASLSGFRVLTIATRPANGEGTVPRSLPERQPGDPEPNPNAMALTTNALSCPAEVTQQLTGPNARPSVHIPLPGWVWNLERRKQWQEALEHWRKVDNLVILVELPPGNSPEAVLLGENLPNMVWLSGSGQADAAETRQQLETLRHARCNLVGAVLNREPSRPFKTRFPRWLGCMALLLCASLGTVRAQELQTGTNTASGTNASFSLSITDPSQRSEWQKHLTLGPGDVLHISVFGESDLTRSEVLVGPDGRINFLEAQNVLASGLTVDELRTNLDNELGKFRREPRSIIRPVAFRSKRYYMLGRVTQRGVYVLNRPLTVIEAVARAHGLETGLSGRNSLDLADFQKCFLMRGGKRYPLDFEKLFVHGDLSQNIPIEPNDYLYFPPASAKEVYVLGEVRLAGPVPYTPDMTVIAALAARGGFTDVAYKTHVVVLRGSFTHPKAFVVDTEDIMYARSKGFKLEPRDIIFVSGRPFLKGEQLIDVALSAFLQSMTAEWAGRNVGPILGTGVIPGP